MLDNTPFNEDLQQDCSVVNVISSLTGRNPSGLLMLEGHEEDNLDLTKGFLVF